MKNLLLILLLPLLLFFTNCTEDDEEIPCTIGAVCDDGDAFTNNDVYNANCDCAGTALCVVGNPCDDGNPLTSDDVYDANCNCEGTSQCVADDPCDDGDPDTYNDVFDATCNCAGTLNVFTDPRDGQAYNTVKIGTQTWMVENMNNSMVGSSWCYNNDPANCEVYGRLYDWNTAINIAPTGWHIPSAEEWNTLINYLGGEAVAGGKMKEAGLAHWNAPNTDATNESGFTGLPGGYRDYGYVNFHDMGNYGGWWSSSEFSSSSARVQLVYHTGGDTFSGMGEKVYAYSVRCIRD